MNSSRSEHADLTQDPGTSGLAPESVVALRAHADDFNQIFSFKIIVEGAPYTVYLHTVHILPEYPSVLEISQEVWELHIVIDSSLENLGASFPPLSTALKMQRL